MLLNKSYILIFRLFAHLQRSLFVSVFDAYTLTLSFKFPILITFPYKFSLSFLKKYFTDNFAFGMRFSPSSLALIESINLCLCA